MDEQHTKTADGELNVEGLAAQIVAVILDQADEPSEWRRIVRQVSRLLDVSAESRATG